MDQIKGKNLVDLPSEEFLGEVEKFAKVSFDIGCGDGKWTYRYAKDNSENLVIGIDADTASLEKVSHKAGRKKSKGGLPNLIFIKSFAESLPKELENTADEIFINFPWGSLLQGVILGRQDFLAGLSKLAKPKSTLKVCTTYHYIYEPQMIDGLGLPELTPDLKKQFEQSWSQHGWQIDSWQQVQDNIPQTSWYKQISDNRERVVWMLKLSHE